MARRKAASGEVSAEVAEDVAVAGVRLRHRHDGWTEVRQRRFLQALAMTGCVRDSARVAGMSNQAGYRLRKISPEFAAAWDRALEHSRVSLRAAAYARAVEGVEEPILHGGKVVAFRRRYSDSLLRMLMQAADPELFGRTGGQMPVAEREKIEQAAHARGREELEKEQAIDLAERRRLIEERLSEMNRRMGGDG